MMAMKRFMRSIVIIELFFFLQGMNTLMAQNANFLTMGSSLAAPVLLPPLINAVFPVPSLH